MTFVDGIKYLSDVDIEMKLGLAANSLKHLAKLAKLATAETAVTAGDTLNDGIKY